ncbi:hypothetical protein ACF1BU_23555 [Streptomyces sp. NPDC014724]|uniref:hypothetical protein n=1 Tax=unclassified Streptomyces TaxID=2593676 RepID=UPI0037035DBE
MEWTTLVSTMSGAVIGVGSTLLADRLRWRRDAGERDREMLRSSYVQFLEALTQARDVISHASRASNAAQLEQVQSALLEHGVHVKQYQLELLAPSHVVSKARDAGYKLALYQDAVVAGARRADPECADARRAFRAAREELMEAMRLAVVRT